MRAVGANAAEQRAYEAMLRTSHQMRVQVKLLKLDGSEVTDLTERLLDGQVNIDSTADVDRQASLALDDPLNTLQLDSDAPAEGAIYLDRMVRVIYGVFVPSLGKWVNVPIFTGPVTGLERDGDTVNLSCLGKEHLARGQAWRPMSFKKGHGTVDAIRAIMRQRAGESLGNLDLPDVRGRLGDPLSLGRLSVPWSVARSLASSLGYQLYYDGAGVCRMRELNARSTAWTFKDGDGGTVLSRPAVAYDLASVSNLVWVKGKKSKGKPQVTGTAVADNAHPLSPTRLGRNGVGRYLVLEVDNDKIRTKAQANKVARQHLARVLREGVSVSFDALPIPHLEPLDVVKLATDSSSVDFTLHQASIPLTHGGVMSIGTNKQVALRKRSARRGR